MNAPSFEVQASGLVPAPAPIVYGILADYRAEHPRIVPKPYFRTVEVERGGVGEGTVVRVEMRVLGSTRRFRHAISEPQPGRVLVETDMEGWTVTTFTVEPVDGQTRLTLSTLFRSRGGVLATLERWMVKSLMEKMYREEIALIARRALEIAAGQGAASV